MRDGLVLAIDTTTEFGSLALAQGDNVLTEVALQSPDGYGHVLFERIGALLAEHRVNVGDIALFAAAAGPGTFTGIRVGLAAAKGLAAALGKPAAAVSNLQALAMLGDGAIRAALLDARRGEVYAGLFNDCGETLYPETVATLESWLAALPDEQITFIAMDPAPFAPSLDSSRFAAAKRVAAGPLLAGSIARLAWTQAKDPALLDANYVRRADAEASWADRV